MDGVLAVTSTLILVGIGALIATIAVVIWIWAMLTPTSSAAHRRKYKHANMPPDHVTKRSSPLDEATRDPVRVALDDEHPAQIAAQVLVLDVIDPNWEDELSGDM